MSTHDVLVALLPKITGCLSILGSSFNLCDILTDRKKRNATYQRLVAAMSMMDIFYSFALFCSTWPIPADSGVLWSSGNQGTCAAQGFMIQFGFAVPMYNLCLTIYCGMVINLKWSIRKIQKYESRMHATVLSLAFGIALAGFPLTLYNNANLWCWIAANPLNCVDGNSKGGDSGVECVRGKHSWIYRWAFFYCPLWLIIVLVTCGVAIIAFGAYRDKRTARKLRQKQSAGGATPAARRRRASSRRASLLQHDVDNLSHLTNNILWQCFYFVFVFYLTWIFPTLLRALQTVGRPVPYAIKALMASIVPLQGFLNAMVFMRPRLLRYRRNNPNEGWCSIIFKVIHKTLAKLKPSNNKTSPTRSIAKSVLRKREGDKGLKQKQQATTTEHNETNCSGAEVKKPSPRSRWWRSWNQCDDEDGNSSDEEDDQRIVTWRQAVAKAFATDEDYDLDPEMIEIRQSVISAMSAAIGASHKSSTTTATTLTSSLVAAGSLRDGGGSPQRHGTQVAFRTTDELENNAKDTQQENNDYPAADNAEGQAQDQVGLSSNARLGTVKENNELGPPEGKDTPVTTTGARLGTDGVSVRPTDDSRDTTAVVQNQPRDNDRKRVSLGGDDYDDSCSDDDSKEEGLTVSERLSRRFPAPSSNLSGGPNLYLS